MTEIEKMESYIYTLVEPLVSKAQAIHIELIETDDFYDYHVTVHPDDVGRVIGKKGRVAKALRTILYSIYFDEDKRVRLTIENED